MFWLPVNVIIWVRQLYNSHNHVDLCSHTGTKMRCEDVCPKECIGYCERTTSSEQMCDERKESGITRTINEEQRAIYKADDTKYARQWRSERRSRVTYKVHTAFSSFIKGVY